MAEASTRPRSSGTATLVASTILSRTPRLAIQRPRISSDRPLRIGRGGVKKRDPALKGPVEHGEGGRLVDLAPERRAAQPDRAYLEVAAA